MAQKIVLMCDKCSSDVGVEGYSIGRGGAIPYDVDLCSKCAQPLVDLVEIGRRAVAGWNGTGLTSASKEPELRSKIYDPEELDAIEEEYRRKHGAE